MPLNLYGSASNLGYGVHSQNMVKALIENGQELCFLPIGDIQIDPFYEMYFKEALNNREKFNAKDPTVYIFHDHLSYQACGSPFFTFSIFETSQLKYNSKLMLNNGPTDIVLTTTAEHKKILEEEGIIKPIEIINEGIDDTIFNTIPVDKYINTKKMTYITVGKREERKNTDVIVRAFAVIMKEKEAALICHTFNPFLNSTQDHPFKNLNCWTGVNPIAHGFQYKGFDGKAHLFNYKNCDIYFTVPTLPVCSMPSLMHSANVGIQVSRGEGWSLPTSELLACGIPTIITDCLGHKEYVTDKVPDVQKKLVISKKSTSIANDGVWFKGDQGVWDDIDPDAFINILEETYKNKNLYEEKSEELANYMSINYSWNNAAKKLIEVINKYKE